MSESHVTQFNLHLTPETVKDTLRTVSSLLRGASILVPGDKGNLIKWFADGLDGLNNSDIFQALVAYLLNTFGTGEEVTNERLAYALRTFADRVDAGQPAATAALPHTEDA
jgi:hypothetical protein